MNSPTLPKPDHLAALQSLHALQSGLDGLRSDTLKAAAFSELVQSQQHLLPALPPRFAEVLWQLLSRLESSVLFTEESCSFSRNDLLDSLQMWLDKAAQALAGSSSSN